MENKKEFSVSYCTYIHKVPYATRTKHLSVTTVSTDKNIGCRNKSHIWRCLDFWAECFG